MGACNFGVIGTGTSAREAFNALVEEAEWEHGHDPYNGTISTCSLGRVTKVADRYTKTLDKKAWNIAEKDDYGEKWQARCLDLGATYWQAVPVTKSGKPSKRAVKTYKRKPKTVNTDTYRLEEYHVYFFYGWAAC